jgi:hypothetical protein
MRNIRELQIFMASVSGDPLAGGRIGIMADAGGFESAARLVKPETMREDRSVAGMYLFFL